MLARSFLLTDYIIIHKHSSGKHYQKEKNVNDIFRSFHRKPSCSLKFMKPSHFSWKSEKVITISLNPNYIKVSDFKSSVLVCQYKHTNTQLNIAEHFYSMPHLLTVMSLIDYCN